MKLMGKWDVWLDRAIYKGATDVEMLGRATWVRFIHDGKLVTTSFPVVLTAPLADKRAKVDPD